MSCPADSARSTAESGISRDIIPGCRETPVRDVVNQDTAGGAIKKSPPDRFPHRSTPSAANVHLARQKTSPLHTSATSSGVELFCQNIESQVSFELSATARKGARCRNR